METNLASPAGAVVQEPTGAVAAPHEKPPEDRPWIWVLLSRSVVWVTIVNVLLLFVFGALSNDWVFLSPANLQFLATTGAGTIILAIGVAVVLSSGELDISPGANLVLSSVVGAKVMLAMSAASPTVAILAGLAACIGTGVVFGFVNACIVSYLRVNSFITTLATLGIGTGAALIIANAGDVFGMPVELQSGFGNARLMGVPVPFVTSILIAAVLWVVMGQTRFGLRVLAMGSSASAAERTGISRRFYQMGVFALMGLLAGIAGFMDIARFNTTNVGGHTIDALSAVAGAIIGGTALFGGVVSIWGAVSGAMLSVILLSGLVVLGLPASYQQIAIGVVLIAAVSIDKFTKHQR